MTVMLSMASSGLPRRATCIGHTVSTDVNVLPFVSFQGYRYCVNFVDHYSGLGFCYFMRHKNEVTAKLLTYISEMARFGIKISNLQSDRGSKYCAGWRYADAWRPPATRV